jgi:GT2 family glycosyltransferase
VSPGASIVIPVHNRSSLTAACLDAVLRDLPADAEVIVVDDASGDETGELLEGYGGAITSLRMERNVGYARACNEGARRAGGEQIVFLNNDTEPRPGWLAALRRHAEQHPAAAVVGARLLYPNGTIQHAGVAFGQDGYPHHIYAGFPADHPAVSRPRRLQAVTGACMLVRRSAFEQAEGFEEGFLNSLEDVDLCLRIGQAGDEVHYCPTSLVLHLESASRGRRDRFERSVGLYRERWRDRVRRDDLELYLEDGLLSVEYADCYPIRVSLDPSLAIVDRGPEEEIERLLEAYARQTSDLLGEVVRLTAASPPAGDGGPSGPTPEGGLDRDEFLARARAIEDEIRHLQLAATTGSGSEPGPRLGYGKAVERVREAVLGQVPEEARVLVVSRGDRELVRLANRRGEHFPQDEGGGYAGHHPADSSAAVAELERLRESGAEYIVFPSPAHWWLDHYRGFARHLGANYRRLGSADCEIYDLTARSPETEVRLR